MQGTRGTSLSDASDAETTGSHRGRRRIGVLLGVAALVAALDQVSKIIALRWLGDGRTVEVVGGVLGLRLVRNPGAAFGIGANLTVVLALIMIAVIVVILTMSRRLRSVPWALALGAMLGGAFGNLIDRLLRDPGLLRGHVIDFLELPNWPVFNLADSAIVAGAVMIAALSLRGVTYDGRGRRAEPGSHERDGRDRRGGHAQAGEGE